MLRSKSFARAACPVFAWLGWGACALAEALIVLVFVETVLITGPVIFVIGSLSIWTGITSRYGALIRLGVANCGICLLFFMLVVTLDWSPRQAHTPFATMGFVYVAATFVLTARVASNAPPSVLPGFCETCGYCLRGLTVPRCPECGTPFDSNTCATCGYNLTGNVSGRCPECGEDAPCR